MDNESKVAVIGMSGRFPGAPDTDTFWQNLARGLESLTTVWPTAEQQCRENLDGSRSVWGMLEEPDGFDAEFFGMSPGEATTLDPQQRIFLEVAWHALESSGYNPHSYQGLIGIYAGCSNTDYGHLLKQSYEGPGRPTDWQIKLGNNVDSLATRACYKLGLRGPGVTVQTACSSSLVSIHLASQALMTGECDIALAGGASVHLPVPTTTYTEGGYVARDGRCRAFDADASGTTFGDAVGVVVLKRLSDAIDSGDNVRAVILGSAIGNDGSDKVGFTAPSLDGQVRTIRTAHLVADIDPGSITYVEAHGTGTPLGDPIEFRALSKAFRYGTSQRRFCALGSVKSNVGHTDAAAGVVGFIKAVLALENRQIPPSLHFRRPNPALDFDESPFFINSDLVEWHSPESPRRAGVNSLGIGGTNAHVVLEEAPSAPDRDRRGPWQLLLASARTSEALDALCGQLSGYFRSTTVPLEDAAWTLQVGRHAHSLRRFAVATSQQSAADVFKESGTLLPLKVAERPRPVVLLFPGQGSQHAGMTRDLYSYNEVFRSSVDWLSDILLGDIGLDLRRVLYPSASEVAEADRLLGSLSVGQPAVFVVEYALAQLCQSLGLCPQLVVGHSVGAYAAATVAGIMDPVDALRLVAARGQLLDRLPQGAMLAVPLGAADVAKFLMPDLELAVVNGPHQCVVSGPRTKIVDLRSRLAGQSIDSTLLRIPTAGHSSAVTAISDEFAERATRITLRPSSIRFISDVRPNDDRPPVTSSEYWVQHLRQAVHFSDALEKVLALREPILLEVGPGRALARLVHEHPAFDPATCDVLSTQPHPADTRSDLYAWLEAIGSLWQLGVSIDWRALHSGYSPRRAPAPTYPFQHQRFFPGGSHRDGYSPRRTDPAPEPRTPPTTSATELSTVQRVSQVFSAVFGTPVERPNDNFFDLGGDSLMATQLTAAIQEEFDTQLSVRSVLAAPTVQQLAQLIDAHIPSIKSELRGVQ